MNLFRRWVGANVASLCWAVLPGKVLQEEGGWGEGGLQGGLRGELGGGGGGGGGVDCGRRGDELALALRGGDEAAGRRDAGREASGRGGRLVRR